MMISYQDLAGNLAAFNSDHFVSVRPTSGKYEPDNAVALRLEGKRIYSASKLEDILSAVGAQLPLASLTGINGQPQVLAAKRVINVQHPTDNHHPQAGSVVSVLVLGAADLELQIHENVEQATDLIDRAVRDF